MPPDKSTKTQEISKSSKHNIWGFAILGLNCRLARANTQFFLASIFDRLRGFLEHM